MLSQSNDYFHTCVISWCRNSIECADSSWFCLLFSSWTNRGWNLTNTLDRKNSRLTDSPPSEGPARGRDIWQASVGGTCAPHSPACPFAPWWSKNILTSSRIGVVCFWDFVAHKGISPDQPLGLRSVHLFEVLLVLQQGWRGQWIRPTYKIDCILWFEHYNHWDFDLIAKSIATNQRVKKMVNQENQMNKMCDTVVHMHIIVMRRCRPS